MAKHTWQSTTILVVMVVLLALWLTDIRHRQQFIDPASRITRCRNNLKQIGLAIHNYHEDHGVFPPAYLSGPSGEPAHTWRVLLLPYIDEQETYDLYRLSEPWNSPHNATLQDRMPEAYRCPSHLDRRTADFSTDYVAVIAEHSVLAAEIPVSPDDIAHRKKGTIFVTESGNRQINWMSPDDITRLELAAALQQKQGKHRGGNNALMADGTVKYLPPELPQDSLESLINFRGELPTIDLNPDPPR